MKARVVHNTSHFLGPRQQWARANKNTVVTSARLFCEPQRAESFVAPQKFRLRDVPSHQAEGCLT